MKLSFSQIKTVIFLPLSFFFFSACSNKQISTSNHFPSVNNAGSIVIYGLENYTDTPRAGLRAANIVAGVLESRGYRVISMLDDKRESGSLKKKIAEAKSLKPRYILTGGVSEWRYKTGIDGEPAVSMHLKLIGPKKGSTLWSATGSDSSWGNASLGVVAQELINNMLPVKDK